MKVEVLAAAMVLFSMSGWAQNPTCHDERLEKNEPQAALYAASPFLHGYRDGYQQGFHDADLSEQFARPAAPPEQQEHFRKVEYKHEFGDRRTFTEGYRRGFRQGFSDMRTGLRFRVFDTLRSVAQALSGAVIGNASRFNSGVAARFDGGAQPSCSAASDSLCLGWRAGDVMAGTALHARAAR